MRATSLFTAEASPARVSETEPRAVEVSGATVTARPTTRTSTRRQHPLDVRAAVGGPAQQGQPGPDHDRSDRHLEPGPDGGGQAPGAGRERQHDHGDREQGHAGLQGRVVVTTWSTTGSRNRTPPSPAYTTKVTALVTANCRFEKSPRGSMGEDDLASTTRNDRLPTTPTTRAASTPGDDHPRRVPR